jgi:crotonobetainyl-CoA:carnitine CoA-transferase CaiB-like acyl-CoA transferase
MAGALDAIRVIDWTIWQQGPIGTAMLGDLGAEVIKIEPRGEGDPGRGLTKLSGIDLSDRPNFYFEANNRNKKSLALDLKKPEAREVVYDLVRHSDVFAQNFRVGVAERLGLDYEALRRHNPRLVYAQATGFGPKGPEATAAAMDQMGIARSGLMLAVGEPGMPPLPIAGGIADQMSGIFLAYGVLAALLAREKSGVGQKVDVSQIGSMAALQGLSLSAKLMMGFALPRVARSASANPLWNHYRCADDRWIALGMAQAERHWPVFCRAIGRPDLLTDPRFSNLRWGSTDPQAAVMVLDEVFATRPRDEWMRLLREASPDFIFAPVNAVDDLPDDPQVLANDYVVEIDHPQFGPTRMAGFPVGMSETPCSIRTPAPEFGQHTEEILLDVLGYDWDRIAELRRREVI